MDVRKMVSHYMMSRAQRTITAIALQLKSPEPQKCAADHVQQRQE